MKYVLWIFVVSLLVIFSAMLSIQLYQLHYDYLPLGEHAKKYGDILSSSFQTTSSVGTFFVAIYVALNAKNWLKSKIETSAYEKATKTLDLVLSLYSEFHVLLDKTVILNNTSPDDLSAINFRKKSNIQILEINEFQSKITRLKIEILNLKIYDIKQNKIDEMICFASKLSDFSSDLSSSISINHDFERLSSNLKYGRTLSKMFGESKRMHNDLTKPIHTFFEGN